MAEKHTISEQQHKQRKTSLCEECNSNAFKYKCPGCSCRTCSLPCVNSHKLRSGCTGKRNPTTFIPLSQFNDSTLLSDYNLLEDVKRVAESAKRMNVKLGGYSHFRQPFYLKALRNAAARRGTKLLLLPTGMSRRVKNKTLLDRRRKSINWTIEWRFHLTDVFLLEHGVQESSTLRSVVEKHLQPSPWKNKLRRFREEDLDNLKFFIRKHHKGSNSPYRDLDLDAPLSRLFAGLAILEYPVIHVFLPSDSHNFEVVKDLRPPVKPDSNKPMRDRSPSPVGIVFKEEEILEDEGAPEPIIIDLLKMSEADGHKPTPQSVQENPEPYIDYSISESTKSLEGNNGGQNITENDVAFPGISGREVEMIDAKADDFELDQEFIDACSFLMEENIPDDFLNFELGGDGKNHEGTTMFFPGEEELEEGEIPAGLE